MITFRNTPSAGGRLYGFIIKIFVEPTHGGGVRAHN